MQITRDEALERVVLDGMAASYGTGGRPEIHLSDLLNPRWAYWQRVKPLPATDAEVQYFMAGRGHEDVFGRLTGFTRGEPRTVMGISYRPDFHSDPVEGLPRPCEFKTRRRNLAPDERVASDYSIYWEQLKGYVALEHTLCPEITSGDLIVFSLVEKQQDGKTKPDLRCYTATWEPDELGIEAERLASRRAALDAALIGDATHEHLPLCWPFKCGRTERTMARKPRCVTCSRDFEGEWGAQKHLDSRTGKGHAMQPAEWTATYVPQCRWYADCQPWLVDPARQTR